MIATAYEESQAVTAEIVPDNERLATLPKLFPYCFMQLESTVFQVAERLCPDYRGGHWEFLSLSNGGFFMKPNGPGDSKLAVSIPFGNGYEGSMTAEALGITVCLYAYCFLAEQYGDLADHYFLLKDFADQHPESEAIWWACD